MNWSSIGTFILGCGGLITGILALLSARANKDKINSETKINLTNAEQARETMHHSRENYLHEEIILMREEITALRRLIELHVPWDWEIMRQLKLAGIEYREPPTLHYIKTKPSNQTKDAL